MQPALFLGISVVITGLALLVSLKQRWLDQRRTIVLRSMIIWAIASVAVVVAGLQMLGPTSLALSIGGSCLVVLLAALASAAR